MDGEDCSKLFEKLNLSEEEKARVVNIEDDDLDITNKDLQLTTMCKILTTKKIISEVFKTIIPKIWNLEDRVKIKSAGKNIFRYTFKNNRDKNRITGGGPWSFDRGLILFEDLKGNSRRSELQFRYVNFWIHLRDLPEICHCRKWAKAIGDSMGTFLDVDTDENGECEGDTLKIKLKLDITKPLCRGTHLIIGAMTEEVWFPITYEKLPNFCYGCGKLGHVFKECEGKHDQREGEARYGDWLRENHGSRLSSGSKRVEQSFRGGRGRGRNRAHRYEDKVKVHLASESRESENEDKQQSQTTMKKVAVILRQTKKK